MMLTDSFFNRDAETVAKELLGKVLRVYHRNMWLAAQIIETEAYYLHEKASHASLGFTPKRSALFMPGGTIYMYHSRAGDSMNISCQGAGNAVLLKSGMPYTQDLTPHAAEKMLQLMQQLNPKADHTPRHVLKLCSGQTLLCKSLGLKIKAWDQKNFDPNKIYIDAVGYQPHHIIQTTRLGITPGRDEHLKLRFIDYQYAAYCTKNPLTKRTAITRHYKIIACSDTTGKNQR